MTNIQNLGKLNGKTIVIKYGGNAMINDSLKNAVVSDIVFLATHGTKVVLVHGGGPEIDAALKEVGKEPRFVNGLRYTDEKTMEIVQMVLCGKINKNICALLQDSGIGSVGICGIDGGLLRASRINEKDLGLVGHIEKVNTDILKIIIDNNFIPVVAPVAAGYEKDKGKTLNINADIAAAQIAAAMHSEIFVLITDVSGLLRDVKDPKSLIKNIDVAGLKTLKMGGIIKDGMIPKADCCIMAINGGVKKALIIDGRVEHSLLSALIMGEGIGTTITGL
ncbi:MAG: acetylglutamate kinase [Termitinemataceae bacterium]|nr:MAG: acetylglutamate kinase [Termitinemataceae bacterium]